jgi:hypothetical protein
VICQLNPARSPEKPSPPVYLPNHFFLLPLSFLRIFHPKFHRTPLFPLHIAISPVTPLFPLDTKNKGLPSLWYDQSFHFGIPLLGGFPKLPKLFGFPTFELFSSLYSPHPIFPSQSLQCRALQPAQGKLLDCRLKNVNFPLGGRSFSSDIHTPMRTGLVALGFSPGCQAPVKTLFRILCASVVIPCRVSTHIVNVARRHSPYKSQITTHGIWSCARSKRLRQITKT